MEKREVIRIIDDLLIDLRINNPTYATAFHLANNPVISTISTVLELNPCWFAKPIGSGEVVQFDIEKIEKVKLEVEKM